MCLLVVPLLDKFGLSLRIYVGSLLQHKVHAWWMQKILLETRLSYLLFQLRYAGNYGLIETVGGLKIKLKWRLKLWLM